MTDLSEENRIADQDQREALTEIVITDLKTVLPVMGIMIWEVEV